MKYPMSSMHIISAVVLALALAGCEPLPESEVSYGDSTSAVTDSCADKCGGPAAGCWCNASCTVYGDCCDDYQAVCVAEPEPDSDTCTGAIGNHCGTQAPAGCWCNPSCVTYGDCCEDYQDVCVADDAEDTHDGYYASISTTASGETLASALHALIDDHQRISYDGLWAAFEHTDPCEGGVFDVYTSRCWSRSQRCGGGSCFNREHTWPRSWWGGGGGAQSTDLFQLRPVDGNVNTRRNNHPYGRVTSIELQTANGSRIGPCAAPEASGSRCFEPADEFKGDLARGYFYMAVRYRGELSCCSETGVQGERLRPWMEAELRQWHADDPPSPAERDRNDRVQSLQGNRNPFIDHPEWVGRIGDF